MPAYLIALIEVRDAERYREYTLHTPRVIAAFGGRMVVRNGARQVLEGPADPRRVIVVEFPTLADVLAFHGSPEYTVLRRMREAAGAAQIIAIDGVAAEAWETAVAASEKLSL
jgi:uncharacterized protein (DUF1330 family)